MASRQSSQFQQGPPPPPHGRQYAPGIQGPRSMPQSARASARPVFYDGPATPGLPDFDAPPTPGAPRRGPAPKGPHFDRRGSGLSLAPGHKKQAKPKQNKRTGVAAGAIASPVALLKELGDALDSAPKAPKSLSFHTVTSLNKRGAQHQSIDVSAKWGSRSGSVSASSSSSLGFTDGDLDLLEGAAIGGAFVGAAIGEMMGDFPDSLPNSRKNSYSSSSSGSLHELPGGVSVGRRDSMRSSLSGHSLTSGASRPHLKHKSMGSSIDELSKPRAGIRESNIARIEALNSRNPLKKLNMGKKPRANEANSSRHRQPRADSVAEGSVYF